VAHDPTHQRYVVVLNDEEQYSIWPMGKPLPAGWRAEGMSGTEEECSAHIDTVWTDMRPLSLRQAMDGTCGAKGRDRA
jgi:MbtH protein